MLNLKDRDWHPFPLNSIFIIRPGQRLTKVDMNKGSRPFIGATDSNNGITNFVSNTNASLDKGVLGVNYNGSVVETFYHPYECIFSDDVKRLRLSDAPICSRYIYLFLKVVIMQQKAKYVYGYKFNEQRMNKQLILLPVIDVGSVEPVPDWQFMNDYIAEREQLQVANYFARAQKVLAEIGDAGKVLPLKDKKWKPFALSSTFTLETGKGKGLNHLTKTPDGISYLGATNRNNAVLCYVKPEPKLVQQGNGIAFIRNGEGSIGYSVYKSEPFIASSDLTIGYNEKLNRYTGLFISTIADTVRGKYNFSYKRSEKRLSKEYLNLPINEFGEPDWAYMEQYAKSITQQQLKNYILFLNLGIPHTQRNA